MSDDATDYRELYDQYGKKMRSAVVSWGQTTAWSDTRWRMTGHTSIPYQAAPQVVERIVEVPVYIDRTPPKPIIHSQGMTRPYHWSERAGKFPGYKWVLF